MNLTWQKILFYKLFKIIIIFDNCTLVYYVYYNNSSSVGYQYQNMLNNHFNLLHPKHRNFGFGVLVRATFVSIDCRRCPHGPWTPTFRCRIIVFILIAIWRHFHEHWLCRWCPDSLKIKITPPEIRGSKGYGLSQ